MKTMFLNPKTWDSVLDTQGNIAVATKEYQQAQDIASSCRVFLVMTITIRMMASLFRVNHG